MEKAAKEKHAQYCFMKQTESGWSAANPHRCSASASEHIGPADFLHASEDPGLDGSVFGGLAHALLPVRLPVIELRRTDAESREIALVEACQLHFRQSHELVPVFLWHQLRHMPLEKGNRRLLVQAAAHPIISRNVTGRAERGSFC